MRTVISRLAAFAVAATALTSGPAAGDLQPPGAPAPTGPIEARIAISQETTPGDSSSEFIIDRPGSYYLTEDLRFGIFGEAKNGILVEASDVTIDLNGYALDGATSIFNQLGAESRGLTFESSLTGILVSGDQENIAILNGTVRDWGDDGIDCGGADPVVIDQLRVISSGSMGLRLWSGAQVTDSQIISNGGIGVSIFAGQSELRGCEMRGNGSVGAQIGTGSLVVDCVISGNSLSGIDMDGRNVIRGCVVQGNGGSGIHQNAGSGCIVSGSTVSNNEFHGIDGGFDILVHDNVCTGNGDAPNHEGAGIRLRNGGSVARENLCTDNEIGIDYGANEDNIVTGNTCLDNSVANFSANTAGNQIGPIGNAATATSPWANFTN